MSASLGLATNPCQAGTSRGALVSFCSDGGDTIGSFCGAVDGFDEGDAAAAFEAIASGSAILPDGLEKIFEDSLVAAEIRDSGGRGALVFVERCGRGGSARVAETGGDDAVVLEDDGAFGAGDFDAARVAGIGGSSDMENAESAAGKFEDGGGGVFGFDLVKKSAGASLHANDVTEEPKEQINGVDALIDEGAAAIERKGAAPARIGVILGRAIPHHPSVHYEGPAQEALVEPALELANVRFHAVLKNDAELDLGLSCGFDERIGARGADFNGLFREDVQTMAGGGDALRGVQAGGAADDGEIHGAMIEEGAKVLIARAAVFAAEASDFFGVPSVDGGDFDAGDNTSGAGVRFRDVAAADEADVNSHGKRSVIRAR